MNITKEEFLTKRRGGGVSRSLTSFGSRAITAEDRVFDCYILGDDLLEGKNIIHRIGKIPYWVFFFSSFTLVYLAFAFVLFRCFKIYFVSFICNCNQPWDHFITFNFIYLMERLRLPLSPFFSFFPHTYKNECLLDS